MIIAFLIIDSQKNDDDTIIASQLITILVINE